mgnify:CR=1 FL=1
MALMQQIKARLTQALKANDVPAKNAIRVLVGKLQMLGQDTDEAVISNLKSLIKQTEEEVETRRGNVKMADGTVMKVPVTNQETDIARLEAEIAVLKEFMPNFLSADQIKTILTAPENQQQVNAAKNAGAATGIAMKILKSHGAIEGNTVKDVVLSVYGQ